MTPEEVKLLQEVVDDIYDQLLDAISRDRKIEKEELRKIADGRIFTGRQAQKLKLVDEIGDLTHAVRMAGKMAGMKEEPEIVYSKEKKTKFWQLLLKQAVSVLAREMGNAKKGYDTVEYLYTKN
jgi:protease-4